MRMRTAVALLLTSAVAFGCEAGGEDELDTMPGEELTPAPITPAPTTPTNETAAVTGQFQAPEGATNTNVSGMVDLRPATMGEGMTLEAQLQGLPPGEHAWHIHAAPCGEQGPVVVAFTETETMQGIGQPLSVGDDGSAQQSVDIPQSAMQTLNFENQQYSIHVHENPGVDHGATIACADLNASGMNTGGTTGGMDTGADTSAMDPNR